MRKTFFEIRKIVSFFVISAFLCQNTAWADIDKEYLAASTKFSTLAVAPAVQGNLKTKEDAEREIRPLINAEDVDALIDYSKRDDLSDEARDYVLGRFTFELIGKVEQSLVNALKPANDDLADLTDVFTKLKTIHSFLDHYITNQGMASSLVFETLENMLWSKIRNNDFNSDTASGEKDNRINLMCINIPMAEINKPSLGGYKTADGVKKRFHEKVVALLDEKCTKVGGKRRDSNKRLAYDHITGEGELKEGETGYSQTRLFIVGLEQTDIDALEQLFQETLKEAGIKENDRKGLKIYAGHMKVGYDVGEVAHLHKLWQGRDNKLVQIKSEIEKKITASIKESTGRAEVAEKKMHKRILGESDTAQLKKRRRQIDEGSRKFIPEGEKETGMIPRLSHQLGYLDWIHNELQNFMGTACRWSTQACPFATKEQALAAYLRIMAQSVDMMYHDPRYNRVMKKLTAGAVVSAWNDGTLDKYVDQLEANLRTHCLRGQDVFDPDNAKFLDIINRWRSSIKMAKGGDEIWVYTKKKDAMPAKGKIILDEVFLEFDKFNAANMAITADARDTFCHKLLEFILDYYGKCDENFAQYSAGVEKYMLETRFDVPDDPLYSTGEGYQVYSIPVVYLDSKGKRHRVSRRKLGEPIRTFKDGKQQQTCWLEIIYHWTEKFHKQRAPMLTVTLSDAEATVVGCDKKIWPLGFTPQDKDWDNNLKLKPDARHTGATRTLDSHGLTRLDRTAISNTNTYQKYLKAKGIGVGEPMECYDVWAHALAEVVNNVIGSRDKLLKPEDLSGVFMNININPMPDTSNITIETVCRENLSAKARKCLSDLFGDGVLTDVQDRLLAETLKVVADKMAEAVRSTPMAGSRREVAEEVLAGV